MIDQMGFVTDLALAFIAFGAGRYFGLSKLRPARRLHFDHHPV